MRNISFALTTEQIRNRTKTVTRRTAWKDLKPGTLLQGVVKGMGLKKGEKVERLCVIRVVDVRREPLGAIEKYGAEEVRREGFPDMTPRQFVEFFIEKGKKAGNVTPHTVVTRIEFEYIDPMTEIQRMFKEATGMNHGDFVLLQRDPGLAMRILRKSQSAASGRREV